MPLLVSAFSGAMWGGVAYVLGSVPMGSIIWGGIFVSPLIGLAAGTISKNFDRPNGWLRALIALVSLYVAAALFGIGAGLFDLLARTNSGPWGSRIPSAVVIQSVLGVLWGLTFTGYFVILWPLAYLNHALVATFWRDANTADSRAKRCSRRPAHARLG